MYDRLLALQSALIDKLGKQPYWDPSITVTTHSRPYNIHWYPDSLDNHVFFSGETPEEMFTAAETYIANLDLETEARITFTRKLAKLLDEAPASIDIAPLRISYDNLLAYHQ